MGKISDALKKVMEERQLQQEVERKQPAKAVYRKKEPVIGISNNPGFKEGRDTTKKLSLEERLKIQEKFSVVKAKDSSGIDPLVVMYNSSSSPIADQYRLLRTRVKSYVKKNISSLRKNMAGVNTSTVFITLTSSFQGEGKTVTAANLAVALAQDLDSRVLLVDCDLRKGSVGELFNVVNEPGLSDILVNEFDYSIALNPTAIDNLFVIPRGDVPANPSELIGSKRMRVFLERLKEEPFTYVIIDTPPLEPFSDAALIGAQTDGVVLVVQANRTGRDIVKKAKEFLEDSRNTILGFVLNQMDNVSDAYGYYHYYS